MPDQAMACIMAEISFARSIIVVTPSATGMDLSARMSILLNNRRASIRSRKASDRGEETESLVQANTTAAVKMNDPFYMWYVTENLLPNSHYAYIFVI